MLVFLTTSMNVLLTVTRN